MSSLASQVTRGFTRVQSVVFAFSPFIGIVNLPNAAVLLPFASLPDYHTPERLIQLDGAIYAVSSVKCTAF